jgi:AcrR family transcriptional regulator
LDGVSLRQIRAAAGASNNNAIQYHFGDLDGLVRAILAKRMAEVDRLQSLLLDRLEGEDRLDDTRSLLDVFIRPLLQPVDRNGERAYARFIVALLNSREGPRHFRRLMHLAPTVARVQALIQAANSEVPEPILAERLRLMASMVLSSAFNRLTPAPDKATDSALIDDALDVATAGVSTLPRKSVRTALAQPCEARARDSQPLRSGPFRQLPG